MACLVGLFQRMQNGGVYRFCDKCMQFSVLIGELQDYVGVFVQRERAFLKTKEMRLIIPPVPVTYELNAWDLIGHPKSTKSNDYGFEWKCFELTTVPCKSVKRLDSNIPSVLRINRSSLQTYREYVFSVTVNDTLLPDTPPLTAQFIVIKQRLFVPEVVIKMKTEGQSSRINPISRVTLETVIKPANTLYLLSWKCVSSIYACPNGYFQKEYKSVGHVQGHPSVTVFDQMLVVSGETIPLPTGLW